MKVIVQFSLSLGLLFLLFSCADDNHQDIVEMGEAPITQLPLDVRPTAYKLQLKIDPNLEQFEVHTEIDIELDKARKGMWLHGNKLNFTSATLKVDKGTPWILKTEQINDAGLLRLDFPKILPAGKAKLIFDHSATYGSTVGGLYKVNEGGESYIFSQFESTDARKVFPSFDEPAHKTPFDISIIVNSDHIAVSNTPIISEKKTEAGRKTLTFATSKLLPSYLVAIAVGPFDVIEGEDIKANGQRESAIPLRGIATRGKGQQLKFAVEHTKEIILALEDYFDYPYPYTKLDLIAVPAMGNSAMENAGAITYGEQLLLLDENSRVEQIRGFYSVHAHELAHQWFGNLVTPKWWNDIWLNEAFATWMAATILDRIYPGEHYMDDQIASTASVMSQDSLMTARKIRQEIESHGDINQAFDGITYVKGGGVLKMFESFLGEDEFRKGIRHYMKKHAWGNTDANDFIQAISEVNDNVKPEELIKSFNSFIEQPGVPIINVELVCDEGKSHLSLSQKRYFPIGSVGERKQTWDIPVCVKYEVEGALTESCKMLTGAQENLNLNSEACPQYIIPNSGGNAYYRWNLSGDQWQSLLNNFDNLNAAEQISAASSLSAAFNAAEIDLKAYLDAVALLAQAKSGQVATAPINDVLTVVQYLLAGDELRSVQAQLLQSYKPRLDALDRIENKTADQQQFYNYLLSIVSRFLGDESWREKLSDMAIAYTGFDTDKKLHDDLMNPNMKSNALRVASDDLGLPFVKHLWTHVKATDDSSLREVMIRAMAFSGDEAAGDFARELILDPELRVTEISYISFHQTYYKSNRIALWQYIEKNYDDILERVGKENKAQIIGTFYNYCGEDEANKIETFFSNKVNDEDGSKQTLDSVLEAVRLCSAFVTAQT
jgi:alanyl aminopeptidase